ncbi:hypothetical protein GCM10010399_94280 [Dactylosporangium fulvum]|uniref:DUF1330 domain-containing protein n=1 Tax=Dactylosporangium fulvum TaxID=53359 RepID=A0ABY5WAF6_9ACTN|nr:hypothetical protein [Dactylosporangium fulvum]UWP86469.1 hypothetical protein Dfulv_20390 [Dactylosporangium fulvum]
MSLTLCVMLWAVDGRLDDLAAYEDDVLTLLGRHGARLVARVRHRDGGDDRPAEVQIIDLPDEAALDAYMRDPDRLAMAPRREVCVARTEIMRVQHVAPR